jgi:hypothetical protein
VQCARSLETTRRGQLADAADRANAPATAACSGLRQRIESIFWTATDILGLERHGARTLRNLFVRIAIRFAAPAAAVALNDRLARPSRSLACYTA